VLVKESLTMVVYRHSQNECSWGIAAHGARIRRFPEAYERDRVRSYSGLVYGADLLLLFLQADWTNVSQHERRCKHKHTPCKKRAYSAKLVPLTIHLGPDSTPGLELRRRSRLRLSIDASRSDIRTDMAVGVNVLE
jgi:hypothetical protein